MSFSNPQNRSPYHLRPRSKVVLPIPPRTAQKMRRLEKSLIKQKIAEQANLPFAEIEGAGERFLTMNGEQLKKYLKAQIDATGAINRPPKPLSDEEQAQVLEKQKLQLAETGLSYLNDISNGDAKYELVSPGAGRFFLSYRCGIYHSNFEAKLTNDLEAKAQLFFLEIVEKVPGKQKVTHCCSLGLSGSKAAATGLNGCRVCSKINHPKKMRFVTR